MSRLFGSKTPQNPQDQQGGQNQNQLQPYQTPNQYNQNQQLYPSLPNQQSNSISYPQQTPGQGCGGAPNAGPSYYNNQVQSFGQSYNQNVAVGGYQHNPYLGQPIPAQPLDEIPPNESDKFGALSRAGVKVARALESDVEISPDLMSKQPPPPGQLPFHILYNTPSQDYALIHHTRSSSSLIDARCALCTDTLSCVYSCPKRSTSSSARRSTSRAQLWVIRDKLFVV